jgi:hypothetical protein
MFLATSFVQRECNRLPCCAKIWGSLQHNVLCSSGEIEDSLGWKWINSIPLSPLPSFLKYFKQASFFYLLTCVSLVFELGLYSTYERKYATFGFLNLANFTKDGVIKFCLFACKWQNFIPPHG